MTQDYQVHTVGKLDEILYRETRDSTDSIHNLLHAPKKIDVTRVRVSHEKGAYCFEFMGNIPDKYLGKQVAVVETLKVVGRKYKHKQAIYAQGLPALNSELVYKK